MASRAQNFVHKLHAVTLVRSAIRRPWWEKRTLKSLKLQKLNQTVVHKNIPSVNGRLNIVKTLVHITPIVLDEENLEETLEMFEGINMEEVEFTNNIRCKQFLDAAGNFNISEFLHYHKNELTQLERKTKETLILEATARKRKVGKSKKL